MTALQEAIAAVMSTGRGFRVEIEEGKTTVHVSGGGAAEQPDGLCRELWRQANPAASPKAVRAAQALLDGATASAVSLLTGLSRESLDELGGVTEDYDPDAAADAIEEAFDRIREERSSERFVLRPVPEDEPARPVLPTGLGAVVLIDNGSKAILTTHGAPHPWFCDGDWFDSSAIEPRVYRVLDEGVDEKTAPALDVPFDREHLGLGAVVRCAGGGVYVLSDERDFLQWRARSVWRRWSYFETQGQEPRPEVLSAGYLPEAEPTPDQPADDEPDDEPDESEQRGCLKELPVPQGRQAAGGYHRAPWEADETAPDPLAGLGMFAVVRLTGDRAAVLMDWSDEGWIVKSSADRDDSGGVFDGLSDASVRRDLVGVAWPGLDADGRLIAIDEPGAWNPVADGRSNRVELACMSAAKDGDTDFTGTQFGVAVGDDITAYGDQPYVANGGSAAEHGGVTMRRRVTVTYGAWEEKA